MTVYITVGVSLDTILAIPHRQQLGSIAGGPLQLLQWLESQLGLEVQEVSFTTRMLQYLSVLRQNNNANRFYAKSFDVDEMGVAKRLLQWRDELYEAGWMGSDFKGASTRLTDIADVERSAQKLVSVNVGQRVQRVLAALNSRKVSVVVITIDPIPHYLAVWRLLLNKLNASESLINASEKINAEEGTDLALIQKLLLKNSIPNEAVALSGDGSFSILKASSAADSSDWLAHYCYKKVIAHSDYQVGLLSEASKEQLDLSFERLGLCPPALGERSALRPIMQVLPLVMSLIWSPLNPKRLLEFLSHPVAPIPRGIRKSLAKVVADNPGIGGQYWYDTIEAAVTEARGRCDDEVSAQKIEDKIRFQIDFWLDCERFAPYPGALLDIVIKKSKMLNDWLNGHIQMLLMDPERLAELGLYRRVQNQIIEFSIALQALIAQGEERIDVDALNRLIRAVTGEGAARPDRFASIQQHKSKLCFAKQPEGFIEPIDTVIWWGCDQAHLHLTSHFTVQEKEYLLVNGVSLLGDDERIQQTTQAWLRPIFSAQKKIILIVHEGTDHHPLFDQINCLVAAIPTIDLSGILRGEPSPVIELAPNIESREVISLPKKQRVWHMPAHVTLSKRELESFSSLERFIYAPYMWVLQYQAKIYQAALLDINDGNRLYGSLAHSLFEEFFNTHRDILDIKTEEIVPWTSSALSTMIETSGAVLLMSGRAAEREYFIYTVVQSLEALVKQLHAAGVVEVVMEEREEGLFTGGKMQGFFDMRTTNSDGREAIVDIKWGGSTYRKKLIESSGYLQLALYAQLRYQQVRTIPDVGFYIINDHSLLMVASEYFPNGSNVAPLNEENIQQLWMRFEHSWKVRRQQLNDGVIEVNVSGTDVDETLLWGDEGLQQPEIYEQFSEFQELVGWEADA